MSDTEIESAVAADPDTFIPDAEWFEKARLVMPQDKEMVTLRLDPEIMAWFRKSGRGYQTRINAVLKAFVEAQDRGSRNPAI
ncbi:MAG: BrnA antitoxin family protein [Magnetococcales bacterium]|nr:BrnA antitoxin family protein [Magnetococcales bacterium]